MCRYLAASRATNEPCHAPRLTLYTEQRARHTVHLHVGHEATRAAHSGLRITDRIEELDDPRFRHLSDGQVRRALTTEKETESHG